MTRHEAELLWQLVQFLRQGKTDEARKLGLRIIRDAKREFTKEDRRNTEEEQHD